MGKSTAEVATGAVNVPTGDDDDGSGARLGAFGSGVAGTLRASGCVVWLFRCKSSSGSRSQSSARAVSASLFRCQRSSGSRSQSS
ncbi:hypothetical protein, partial [Geodermatophilus africanus]